MILLHRLNGSEFIINDQQIETIESTPDTVITLINDHKYIVREPAAEVLNLVVAFRQRIIANNFLPAK